jgi:hypothetical protein
MAFGQYVVDEPRWTDITVPEEAVETLRGQFDEFFQNWSVVTGIPLPSHLERKSFYWECCAIERYWIGGARAPAEEEDAPPPEPQPAVDRADELYRIQDELMEDS